MSSIRTLRMEIQLLVKNKIIYHSVRWQQYLMKKVILEVLFHNKVQGIAPGQSAAFYEGNDLVAGGFIMKKHTED